MSSIARESITYIIFFYEKTTKICRYLSAVFLSYRQLKTQSKQLGTNCKLSIMFYIKISKLTITERKFSITMFKLSITYPNGQLIFQGNRLLLLIIYTKFSMKICNLVLTYTQFSLKLCRKLCKVIDNSNQISKHIFKLSLSLGYFL